MTKLRVKVNHVSLIMWLYLGLFACPMKPIPNLETDLPVGYTSFSEVKKFDPDGTIQVIMNLVPGKTVHH